MSETKRHLKARTMLFLLLEEALSGASVGSEQFVYWDASDPKRCLSPDVFVKLSSTDQGFESWKIWERGAPDLAVEIVSESDRSEAEWEAKLARYQVSGISEVVRFDADELSAPIRVWDRVEGELVERAPGSAALRECGALGLWWVAVPSDLGLLLRLARDPEGNELLPTPSEERSKLRAELAEERRARGVAEHDRIVAEHERRLAEQAKAQAEQAKAQAEQAKTQAEQAKTQAEQAKTQAEQAKTQAEQAKTQAEQELFAEKRTREAAEKERDAAAAEVERLRAELERLRAERPRG